MTTTAVTNHGDAVSTPTLPLLLNDPTMGTWAAGETKTIDNTFTDVLGQFQAVGAQFDQGKVLSRRDTFKRGDSGSWGTASDTNVWTTTHPASDTNTATLYHKAGKYVAAGAVDGPLSLLGAALASADTEALVRCKATAASGALGAGVVLRAATDFTSYAWLEVLRSGASTLTVLDGTNPSATHTATWAGVNSGKAFWVRFQAVGTLYKWRIWPDSVSEPTAWTSTFTSALTLAGRSVGLYATMHGSGDIVEYDHFDVYTIS